ncbi:hypothetical protein EW146_g5102 [Bondarzewia mesenterica]|uniref:Uncharacterized protein n=1 Tax=Bondarzewia mesenterica TaxID=1095465 RepID=A0A4S4LSH0_9AGAM|nr:hypothetical protein EW146_g5102 [Bondarzewia mesenterica]
MPSLSTSSQFRVLSQSFSLTVHADHVLAVDEPSDIIYTVKNRFPQVLDVQTTSNLTLSLSGAVHAEAVPAQQMVQSSVTRHLHTYIKANADLLGLSDVSDVYTDHSAGIPKFSLTPSSSLYTGRPPRASLLSIHLSYVWKPFAQYNHPYGDIFSPQLLLPFKATLDEAVQKFARIHLVRRYPLIFGPWRKKLDTESKFFSPLSRTLLHTISRSPNAAFRRQCKKLLKQMRNQVIWSRSTSATALRNFVLAIGGDDASVIEGLAAERDSEEDVLCAALERTFRAGIRPPIFKGINASPPTNADVVDEGTFDLSPDLESSRISADTPDVGLTWDDLPIFDLAGSASHSVSSAFRESTMDDDLWLGDVQEQDDLAMNCDKDEDDVLLPVDLQRSEIVNSMLLSEDEGVSDDDDILASSSSLYAVQYFQHISDDVPFYGAQKPDNISNARPQSSAFSTQTTDLDCVLLDLDDNCHPTSACLSFSEDQILSPWSSISDLDSRELIVNIIRGDICSTQRYPDYIF